MAFERRGLGHLDRGPLRHLLSGTPRGGGSGPPPLRSAEFPLGLPSLEGKNLEKVQQGNRLMFAAAEIANLALRRRIVGGWKTRLIHVCGFASPWCSSSLSTTSKIISVISVSMVQSGENAPGCVFGMRARHLRTFVYVKANQFVRRQENLMYNLLDAQHRENS